jgi:hypothetical protein
MDEQKECDCPKCVAREEEAREHDEMGMAVLVALVPMLVMTLFSQIGIL